MMLKLAHWSTTHRKYVVIGWIVLLLGVNALAQSAGTDYSNNFTLPNSDAQRAADLLQRSFPAQAATRSSTAWPAARSSTRRSARG
jgi:RND superfamily putative drug exporter